MDEKEKDRIIKILREGIYQIQQESIKQTKPLQHALELIDMYTLLGKKHSADECVGEVQSITCYGSIAFCCGIQKNCVMRDIALLLLGIPKDKFEKKKREWVKQLMG